MTRNNCVLESTKRWFPEDESTRKLVLLVPSSCQFLDWHDIHPLLVGQKLSIWPLSVNFQSQSSMSDFGQNVDNKHLHIYSFIFCRSTSLIATNLGFSSIRWQSQIQPLKATFTLCSPHHRAETTLDMRYRSTAAAAIDREERYIPCNQTNINPGIWVIHYNYRLTKDSWRPRSEPHNCGWLSIRRNRYIWHARTRAQIYDTRQRTNIRSLQGFGTWITCHLSKKRNVSRLILPSPLSQCLQWEWRMKGRLISTETERRRIAHIRYIPLPIRSTPSMKTGERRNH